MVSVDSPGSISNWIPQQQSQQAFINNHGVFEMYSAPWYKPRWVSSRKRPVSTVVSLELKKSAIEHRDSAIFRDPRESSECAFVSFLCCRKMWAVLKEMKLVILYRRPITKFLWLGVARFAFSGPLEHHCCHILKHSGAAGRPTVLLCCQHRPVPRACLLQVRRRTLHRNLRLDLFIAIERSPIACSRSSTINATVI